MAVSLDKHERQILLLLQKDGRMSIVDIAQAIGVTEGTVRRKLARLFGEGIIKVAAVADPQAIGFNSPAIIGLKVDRGRVLEVAEAVCRLKEVRYAALTTGDNDLVIEGYWANNEELSRFLLDELPKVQGILETRTSLLLRLLKQSYDWGLPVEEEAQAKGAS